MGLFDILLNKEQRLKAEKEKTDKHNRELQAELSLLDAQKKTDDLEERIRSHPKNKT